jgi:hypothetical protein
LLQEAQQKMGLEDGVTEPASGDRFRKNATRCWAMLLARIYECLPLQCPRCGQPMRIIAFILEPPVIERVLTHVGEPTSAPEVLPARAPPQGELGFDQAVGGCEWPEMDQAASAPGDPWD